MDHNEDDPLLDVTDLGISIDDFVQYSKIDEKLITESTYDSIDDIIENCVEKVIESDEEDVDEELNGQLEPENPFIKSYPDALKMLINLEKFALNNDDTDLYSEIKESVIITENNINKKQCKQKIITDYFKIKRVVSDTNVK